MRIQLKMTRKVCTPAVANIQNKRKPSDLTIVPSLHQSYIARLLPCSDVCESAVAAERKVGCAECGALFSEGEDRLRRCCTMSFYWWKPLFVLPI